MNDASGLTRAQALSSLIARLEEAGCEVSQEGEGRLAALLPGWEQALFPVELPSPWSRLFLDKMIVSVDADGTARYRMVYWTGPQLMPHLLITAGFAFEAWFGEPGAMAPARFFLNLAFCHLLPAVVFLAGTHLTRRSVFREAALGA